MENSEQKQYGTNVEEINNLKSSKSYELLERIELKQEPLQLVKTEKGKFLMLGQYALTEGLENQKEVDEWINENLISLIITIAGIINEKGEKNGN